MKAGTYEFFTEGQTVTQKAELRYDIQARGTQTYKQFNGINMSKPIKIELRGLGITTTKYQKGASSI